MFLVLLSNSTFLETILKKKETSGAENEAEWTLDSKAAVPSATTWCHHQGSVIMAFCDKLPLCNRWF